MFDWLKNLFHRKKSNTVVLARSEKTVTYESGAGSYGPGDPISLSDKTPEADMMRMLMSGEADIAIMEIAEDSSARVTYNPTSDELSIEEIAKQAEQENNISGGGIEYDNKETEDD